MIVKNITIVDFYYGICYNKANELQEEHMEIVKLKPCPFCGGKAKVFSFMNGGICIKCMNCYCQTEIRTDGCIADAQRKSAYEMCVKDWNKRINYENEL